MIDDEKFEMMQLSSLLSGVFRTVRDVIVRELVINQENYATVEIQPPDPALEALKRVVNSITTGKSLKDDANSIALLINNQESRAELIDTLVLTHEYSRLLKFLNARQRIEDMLLSVAEKSQLNPTECLAFLAVLGPELKSIQTRVKNNSVNGKDIFGLLAKVDYALQQNDAEIGKKFTNTSPQNREVVRRLAHKLTKYNSNTGEQK